MSEGTPLLFDLSGKTAMVTGGGSGIGREFCDILAAYGADVVCPDLYLDRAKETCGLLRRYGHTTLPFQVDVSNYKGVQAMFMQVENAFGKLDILVNNAGISTPSIVVDQIDINEWQKVINVNLHGVFYCMKEGLKIMMKQNKGSIINIASIAGICAVDPDIMAIAPYVTSKSAIIGLTKQAAAEYGPHGIRVNCIAPGWHPGTRLAQDANIIRTAEETKELRQKWANLTPLKRNGDPRELKSLLLYLASDASSFVTGQTIAHDGGWTVW